jgi:hypothetical protein
MGLFQFAKSPPLDPTKTAPNPEWVASKIVPFSGRMIIERLKCSGHSGPGAGTSKSAEKGFVRVFVNDKLQPLEFCRSDKNGLCTVDAFVESQVYARNNGEGDFEKCFTV